jgi:hypothetical protein
MKSVSFATSAVARKGYGIFLLKNPGFPGFFSALKQVLFFSCFELVLVVLSLNAQRDCNWTSN